MLCRPMKGQFLPGTFPIHSFQRQMSVRSFAALKNIIIYIIYKNIIIIVNIKNDIAETRNKKVRSLDMKDDLMCGCFYKDMSDCSLDQC